MFTKLLALFALLTSSAHAAYFPTFTINNFDQLGIYNLTLPVLTDGGMSQVQLDVNGRLLVNDNHATDWTALLVDTGSIDSKLNTLGQKLMAGSMPVTMASDQGPIDVNITTPITVSNPSVGLTGAAVPTYAAQMGANKAGNLEAPTLDASNNLNVNVQTSALPTGAATAANQATIISDTGAINATTVSIDGKLAPLGQALMAASMPVTIASNQSAIPVSFSGTSDVNLLQVGGTATAVNNGTASAGTQRVAIASDNTPFSVNARAQDGAGTALTSTLVVAKQSLDVNVAQSALPAGAATDTNQFTEIASLSAIQGSTTSIDSKIANGFGVATAGVRTASQVGNATGAADFGAGNKGSQTLRVVIATDQSALPITAGGNTVGTFATGSISGVTTLTAPASATGFIIQAEDTNTANLRFSSGTAASASSGIQLQPGRSEQFDLGANVSICPESGTQKYSIQWKSP